MATNLASNENQGAAILSKYMMSISLRYTDQDLNQHNKVMLSNILNNNNAKFNKKVLDLLT